MRFSKILDLKLVGQDLPLQFLQKCSKAGVTKWDCATKCDCTSSFTLLTYKYTKN